jgi:thioredoxin-like negative regulator of GroEL
MPVDDMARAPLSQFSRSSTEIRSYIECTFEKLRSGAPATPLLEELDEAAERDGWETELTDAYAGLVASSDALEQLPPDARLELLLEAAWSSSQLEGRETVTLAAALGALDLSPADERALALAEPLLLEEERYCELADRYGVAASMAGSEERARQLLERALHMLDGVPSAAPAMLGLSERLAKLPALREGDDALLAQLTQPGPEAQAALVKLGERWLQRGSAREGIAQLPVELAPFTSESALDVLERLFDQAEDTTRLESVLGRRVLLETSELGRARALEKLAAFEHETKGDTAAARASFLEAAGAYRAAGELEDAERAYERLLDAAGDDARAATELVMLRARAGNFAGVADAFGVLLRAEADNRKACDLLCSIAPDAESAAAADEFSELCDNVLWRLGSEPHERQLSEQLLRQTARLFAVQTRYDEAAELYRRLIADHATSEDLDSYQALIESNPASDWRAQQQRWLFEWQEHHSSDRPSILLSWARFEEQELGDPGAALQVLARAAELAPDRAEVWENLARLRLSEGDGDGGLSATHELRRLGRDVDGALLDLVLEHDPAARWAVDRVKLTLSSEGRWSELFDLYDRAIAAAKDDQERASFLDEAAVAARDVAQDRGRAVGYWERYSALLPGNSRVDLALERLYEQAGNEQALIGHLERRLARAAPEQRADVERRIVELSLSVGSLTEALSVIEGAADRSPLLLEQVFARSRELAEQPSARDAGRRAARLLRESYAARGEPEACVRLLRAELELPLEAQERKELLGELSRTCERELSDLPAAFEAERALYELTLAERERKRLEKLAKKLGRFGALCDTYESAADSELGPDARRTLYRRAAELALGELGDPKRATALYGRLFEVEPERARELYEQLAVPPALEALCGLLERSRLFRELASVLEREAEQRPTPELFSRLGRLQADELGAPASAIASHLMAADVRAAAEVFLRQPSVFGDDVDKALELSRRLASVGLPEGSLRVLRHQLAHYAEHYPPERKLVHLELVGMLEETRALDAAQRELTETARRYPTDAEVQRKSAAAAVARRDWDKAEQAYRSLLLLLHGGGARTTTLRPSAVYVELAVIKRQRGDRPAADELLASGFEAALGSAAELTALARALLDHELWNEAERATGELLTLAKDLPTAARALAGVAELARQSQAAPAPLLAQAATLAEQAAQRLGDLDDPQERSSLIGACVSLLPLPSARTVLAQREAELGEQDGVNARLELARRLLAEGDDSDRAAAIALLRSLATHPDAATNVWERLVSALERSEDPVELERTLSAWLERSPNDPAVLTRGLRFALSRSDAARALELYDRLTRTGESPEPELSSLLCQLCLQVGEHERAVRLLRAEAEREPKPGRRAALLVEAAELMLTAGDTSAAAVAVSEARALDPSLAEAVLLLAKLELAAGRKDSALELLTSHAESKERRRGKPLSRVLRLAADLHLERDELGEALPLLLEAHQLDKTDLDTALLLGLLAIDLDRLETAASALRVLIAQREHGTREGAAARGRNLAEGYFQLARIELHHGKKTNAKRMALRALEENPQLVPARRLLGELGHP